MGCGARFHAHELRGVHLRPHRLGIREQHLRLSREHWLSVHSNESGAANGQFSGIGSDESQICVKIGAYQPMGLLISNGQFVCMHGDTRIPVLIEKTCNGSVRLPELRIWDQNRQCVVPHSRSFVSLSDCYSEHHLRREGQIPPAIEADAGGKLQAARLVASERDEPGDRSSKGLRHAIITENNGANGVERSPTRLGTRPSSVTTNRSARKANPANDR